MQHQKRRLRFLLRPVASSAANLSCSHRSLILTITVCILFDVRPYTGPVLALFFSFFIYTFLIAKKRLPNCVQCTIVMQHAKPARAGRRSFNVVTTLRVLSVHGGFVERNVQGCELVILWYH